MPDASPDTTAPPEWEPTGTYLDELPPEERPFVPPPWEKVQDKFQAAFPRFDLQVMQKDYEQQRQLSLARAVAAKRPETAESWLLRRSVPGGSSVGNVAQAVQYSQARGRLGTPQQTPADANLIAHYEDQQRRDAEQGQTWQGGLAQAGAHIPAIAGEFAAGSGLMADVGTALPASVTPWVTAPAAAEGTTLPSLLTSEGLKGLARGTPSYLTRSAALTTVVPSMYANQWTQNNLEAGRPALHPAGLPAAYGTGVAQVAVLGSLGRLGLEAPGEGLAGLAARSALRGVGGVAEQQAVDIATSAISEPLPDWLKTKTRYGLLGELLDPKQRDDVTRHAAIQALTFAGFGLLHEAQGRGPAPEQTTPPVPGTALTPYEPPGGLVSTRPPPLVGRVLPEEPVRPPPPVLQAFADLMGSGLSRDTASRQAVSVGDRLVQAINDNPNLTAGQARTLFAGMKEGPLRRFALSLAETLPEAQRQLPPPEPQAAPPAAPERPPVPAAQSPTFTAPRRAQSLYDSMVDTFGHNDTLARVRRLVPELAPDWQPQQSRDAAALYQDLRRKGMSDKAASAAVQTAYPVQSGGKAAPGYEAVLGAGVPPEETEGAAVPPAPEHLPAQGPSPGLEEVPPGESDDSPATTLIGRLRQRQSRQGAQAAVAQKLAPPNRAFTAEEGLSKPELEEEAHFASVKYEDIPPELRSRTEAVVQALEGKHPAEAIRESSRGAYAAGGSEGLNELLLLQEERLKPPQEATPENVSQVQREYQEALKEFGDEFESAYRTAQRSALIEASVRRRLAARVHRADAAAAAVVAQQGSVTPAPARPTPAAAPAVPETTSDVVGAVSFATSAERPRGAIQRVLVLNGQPREDSTVEIVPEDAGQRRTALRSFPDLEKLGPPDAKVHRLLGIHLEEELQGKGLGQKMMLDALAQAPNDWLWNSQLSKPGTAMLERLEAKGLVEVYTPGRGDEGSKPGVAPIAAKARAVGYAWNGLGQFIARLTDAGRRAVAGSPPETAAAPAVPETPSNGVGEGLTAARLRSVASSEWERPVVDDFLNQPLGEDPLLGETHADLLRRLWRQKGLPAAQVEAFIAARQHEARAREEARRQDPLRALEASGSGRNYFKPGLVTPAHEERLQQAVAAGVVATGEDAKGRWYQRTGNITAFLNAESAGSPGTARTPAVPKTPGDVVSEAAPPGESDDSPEMPATERMRRGRVEKQQADLFEEAGKEGIPRDDLHRHAQEIREADKLGVADDKELRAEAMRQLQALGVSPRTLRGAEDEASVKGIDEVASWLESLKPGVTLFDFLKHPREVLTEKQAYRQALDNLIDQKQHDEAAAAAEKEHADALRQAAKAGHPVSALAASAANGEADARTETQGSGAPPAAPAGSPAGPAAPGAAGPAAATGGAGAAEVGDAAGGGTGGRATAELEASRQALVRYGFPPGDLAREEREALGMIQSLRPGEGWSHSLQNVIDSYEDGTDEANPEIGNEQQMMREHLRKLIAVVNPAALGPKPVKGHSPSTAPPEQGDAAGGGDTDPDFDVASFGAARGGRRGGGAAPPPGTPGARAGGAPPAGAPAAAPAGAWFRAVGRWLRSAAQQAFPATTDLARESGEKMAQAAAARDAAIAEWRYRAKDLGVDQLERPEALADNMLAGTTLLEFRARYARAAWQKEAVRQSALAAQARAAGDRPAAQKAALAATEAMRQAQAIVVFVGQPGSPLPTEARYQQSIQDIKPLIEKMVQKWTPVVDAQYRSLKGIDPMDAINSITQIPGLPLSAIALPPETPDGPGIVRIGRAGGGTSGMQGLLIRRPGFTRAAGLDAAAYDVRLTEMLKQRLLTGVEGVARAEAVRQLLADGILKDQGKGDAVPPGFKYLGLDPNKGIAGIDPNARYFVHPEAYREVMNGLGIGQRAAETMLGEAFPAVQGVNDKLYNLALMSPVELTRHTYNHLRALFKPGMGFPLWNLYESIGNFKKVWDQDPAMMGRVADLAKIGASFEHQARPGILGEGLADRDPTAWVNHWTSKFIDTMQKAVRVQLDDAWGRIVKVPGGPEDTETGRRDFINQALGNYNARSSNGVLQFLKDTGLQGFGTASWTGTTQGIRALGGGLNMKPTTLEGQIKFRAIAYAKMLPLLALGPVTNYLLHGEAFPQGVPPFAIKTRDKEDGRVGYIDPVEITGLRRGMRATGIEAAAEDVAERVSGRPGQEMGAVSQQGIHQALGAGAGMLEGPPVQALHTAITGENFSGHRVAPKVTTATTPAGIAAARRKGLPPPGSNQYAYNAGAAILNINPAVGTFLQADRPAKSRGLAESAARMLGPFGEQEREKPKIGRKGKTR